MPKLTVVTKTANLNESDFLIRILYIDCDWLVIYTISVAWFTELCLAIRHMLCMYFILLRFLCILMFLIVWVVVCQHFIKWILAFVDKVRFLSSSGIGLRSSSTCSCASLASKMSTGVQFCHCLMIFLMFMLCCWTNHSCNLYCKNLDVAKQLLIDQQRHPTCMQINITCRARLRLCRVLGHGGVPRQKFLAGNKSLPPPPLLFPPLYFFFLLSYPSPSK